MNLGSQRIMKMGCVVRAPLHYLAAQPRETAIFEGEPYAMLVFLEVCSENSLLCSQVKVATFSRIDLATRRPFWLSLERYFC